MRISQELAEDIIKLTPKEFNVFLFYIALISRGIFFLHKHIGNNPKHQNWYVDPKLAYSVVFFEVFNDKQAIIGSIMPERIPICY